LLAPLGFHRLTGISDRCTANALHMNGHSLGLVSGVKLGSELELGLGLDALVVYFSEVTKPQKCQLLIIN